jgi:D-threonate/D-erythronate kinase
MATEDSAGVAVVADDLTGAADTAVHFLRPGHEILLVSLARDASGPPLPAGGGLAVDTGTRGSGPVETVRALRRAAGLVRRLRPGLVYKKVDSQLRGRPGLEIETLRRELGLRCALVAPAYPDQGRVTRGGVHLVHGVPVAEAEPGRDPVAPVTESRLPALVAAQSGVEVAHVSLADLERGAPFLDRRIEGLVAEGHKAITFDAMTARDLELVAEVASSRSAEVLLAGSAGLAMALAARRRSAGATSPPAVPRGESMLIVCGSPAAALRRQVARLVTSGRCVAATATPGSSTGEACRDELERSASAWAVSDVVLKTPEDRLDAATCAPSAILAGLAELAVALLARRKPDGLFLSGGDTARAVLAAAGVGAVRLRGEASPGVAWGLAVGGMLDGVTVLTRSGAFGSDEDLVALHDECRKGATHD